ncbi:MULTISPECIES: DUF4834 family protein [Flavobacteriaceae]|uniref:DUF4834 family protein n=1 Tax=Flagellimonas alvinocaridis TaxID=2530200 RepID=A0A4S8RH36_9FLAO|nr:MULTISPECIES: DUF4834 family protein [Allomuricauda]MDC6363482.1 DUF4834 family protein [Muricauda sp. SP22]THV57637.1 DUF4834 family protein [Allomuricauda alvinocaridis]
MVVLKTILFLILVYYAFKLLAKWLAPRLFNYAVKKTHERFGQEFGSYQHYGNEPNDEGKTTIFKGASKGSKPSKKVGEYIDFEEID